MNFEFNQTLVLNVSVYVTKDGADKLGFAPVFEPFDRLIYDAVRATMTEKEREAEDRNDLWDDFEDVHFRHTRRSRRPGPHASMRIFHLSGSDTPDLVKGDAWEVEVVKCYAATQSEKRDGSPDGIVWTEPKTKDGRTKIHFTVKPVKRIVSERRYVLWGDRTLMVETVCGSNRDTKEVPIQDVQSGEFRFTDSNNQHWVLYATFGFVNGELQVADHYVLQARSAWMNEKGKQNAWSQIKFTTDGLKAAWQKLPEAPASLWNHIVKKEHEKTKVPA